MSDEFWLTLPSNSSMDIYPQNTLQNYTTKLTKPLNLTENYEVALAQITFPNNFSRDTIIISPEGRDEDEAVLQIYKINNDKSLTEIENTEYELQCTRRGKKYYSLKQLVGEINKEIKKYRAELPPDNPMRSTSDLPSIVYNQTYKRYTVTNEVTRLYY